MSKHQATPEVLRAMLKKARQKLAAARKDMEFDFFGRPPPELITPLFMLSRQSWPTAVWPSPLTHKP